MRIHLRKLVISLLVMCVIGCVFLLSSTFSDLDLRFESLKQKQFRNSRYIAQRHVNISIRSENVTTDSPALPTIRHIVIDTPTGAYGDCSSAIVLPKLIVKHSWQPVDDKKQVYVFSAYLEGQTVRLIGVKSTSSPKLHCQLFYRTNKTDIEMVTVAASSTTIPEGHGRRYTASQFLCRFSGSRKPYAVSLVDKKCGEPKNIVTIHSNNIEKKRNFTVCTTPLNFHYNRAYELIEWIELNRILGVNFFTLYNHTTGPDVNRVLQYYEKQGVLEVIQWNLPMGVDTWPRTNTPVEIHYFGQLAASNDCLRRNRNFTKYLVIIDLDEFIIPRAEGAITLSQMMEKLPESGSYVFCNTFFREDWNDTAINFENKDRATQFQLNTLLKLNREKKIFPHNSRSKYIVQPFGAEVLGIHQTWQMSDKRNHLVSKDVGLVHHYRNWENPFDKIARVEDRTVLDKFKTVLIGKVSDVLRSLKEA